MGLKHGDIRLRKGGRVLKRGWSYVRNRISTSKTCCPIYINLTSFDVGTWIRLLLHLLMSDAMTSFLKLWTSIFDKLHFHLFFSFLDDHYVITFLPVINVEIRGWALCIWVIWHLNHLRWTVQTRQMRLVPGVLVSEECVFLLVMRRYQREMIIFWWVILV